VDEDYWEQFRGTPKAYVSLAQGRKLWASRFGQTTALRVASAGGNVGGISLDDAKRRWRPSPEALGLSPRPVRAQAVAAASGTTPFGLLFLGFSLFIVAAAVLLVVLLVRLGVERRAREIGTLLALGFTSVQVRRTLALEGLVVAFGGAWLGMPAGVAYAQLMVYGLTTWWVQAVSTPFLQLEVAPWSLVIGWAGGVLISFLAVLWALRQLRRLSVRRLLADQPGELPQPPITRPGRGYAVAGALCGLGAISAMVATRLGGEAQAGAFFAGAALALLSGLAALRVRLRSHVAGSGGGALGMWRFAGRSAARNPGRTLLATGLMAAASFLIVAIGAFRQDPSSLAPARDSGNGGYALLATSDQPIYQDLNRPEAREQLGFTAKQAAGFANTQTVSLRVQPGDDASCLNLYRPRQPQFLGVPASITSAESGRFAWAGHAAESSAERANPWRLLERPLLPEDDGRPVVPVVVDMNTAMYSLHLWTGVGTRFDIELDGGARVRLELVGLLKNSLLQGSLMVSEAEFLRQFPEVSGYRMFLVEAPPGLGGEVERTLESVLGDYGLDARGSGQILSEFLAVQNTYLSTFQSLAGLGLLLGTLGLGTVQLRNVLERRAELALFQALGFSRRLLGWLVFFENSAILGGGLLLGCGAALIAVLPQALVNGVHPPWALLGALLGMVLAAGALAGLAAVRATLAAPLVPALRGE
jgi:putative ABC transport system permease protein